MLYNTASIITENKSQLSNSSNLLFEVLQKKNIRTLFQPIISLRDGAVFGYEALSRGPKGSALESPEVLISCARENNVLFELEYLFRYSALRTAAQLPLPSKLFLNVDPNIIQDERFKGGFTKKYLQQFFIDPNRVVF